MTSMDHLTALADFYLTVTLSNENSRKVPVLVWKKCVHSHCIFNKKCVYNDMQYFNIVSFLITLKGYRLLELKQVAKLRRCSSFRV